MRVKDAEVVRATLDSAASSRGMRCTDVQWSFCGRIYQVEHVVRRMTDDHFRLQPVSQTVTRNGADCRGADRNQGCGLACALLFRDEWLEPADPPTKWSEPSAYATIRSLAEIRATLDSRGRLHGIPLQPGMARYAGTSQPILTHATHETLPAWLHPLGDWYVLGGLRCDGEPLGTAGCDRRCALLWHRSWLHLNTRAPAVST